MRKCNLLFGIAAVTVLSTMAFAEDEGLVKHPAPSMVVIRQEDDTWKLLSREYEYYEDVKYYYSTNGTKFNEIDFDGVGLIDETDDHLYLKSTATDCEDNTFETFDFTVSVPGQDYIYSENQTARLSIMSKDPSVTKGTQIYMDEYIPDSLSSTNPAVYNYDLFYDGQYGVALLNDEDNGCGAEFNISFKDTEKPKISWSKDGEYKDVEVGIDTSVSINVTDKVSGVKNVQLQKVGGGVYDLEEPYTYTFTNNGQWMIIAYDNAGNRQSQTIAVNWYKVNTDNNGNGGGIVDDSDDKDNSNNNDNTDDDDNENSIDYKNYISVTSSTNSKVKENSSWDDYWESKPDKESSDNTAVQKLTSTSDNVKPPVAPTGYKYVYRDTEVEEDSAVEDEKEKLRELLKQDGIEASEEELAITKDVTLQKIEPEEDLMVEEESNIFKLAIFSAIVLAISFMTFKFVREILR